MTSWAAPWFARNTSTQRVRRRNVFIAAQSSRAARSGIFDGCRRGGLAPGLIRWISRPKGAKTKCAPPGEAVRILVRINEFFLQARRGDVHLLRGIDLAGQAVGLQLDGLHLRLAFYGSRKADLILVLQAPVEVLEVRLERNRVAIAFPIAVAARGLGNVQKQVLARIGGITASIKASLVLPVDGINHQAGPDRIGDRSLHVRVLRIVARVVVVHAVRNHDDHTARAAVVRRPVLREAGEAKVRAGARSGDSAWDV